MILMSLKTKETKSNSIHNTVLNWHSKNEYMIIKYNNHVSFQRCGVHNGSGEYDYPSLQELYQTITVDGICLYDRWNMIETIIADSTFILSIPEEMNSIKERWICR